MRSFVSIPAACSRASPLYRPDPARLCNLVLRACGGRVGARKPVGGVPPLLPLRRLRDHRVDRRRHRVRRLEALSPAGSRRERAVDWRAVRIASSTSRPVRAADPAAQAGLRRGARERSVRVRPERCGVRARGGRVSRRARDNRRRQPGRTRSSSSSTPRRRPRRRGDLPVVHVLRHRRGDRPAATPPSSTSTRSPELDPADVERKLTAQQRRSFRCTLRPPGAARRAHRLRRADRRGRRAGVRLPDIAGTGIASTFSFYPTKNLFGLGDGGLVAVRDAVAERIRMLRFHGSKAKKTFEYIGYNSRLDEIQAAALRIFLRELDGWTAARREAAAPLRRAWPGRALRDPGRRDRPRLPPLRLPLARARPDSCRVDGGGDRNAEYHLPPLHLQPAPRYLGYEEGALAGDRARCSRELLRAVVGGHHGRAAGAGRRRSAAVGVASAR